ncbi:MAG TPA: hypothetical protein ACQGQI_02015 [Xylella sp.]
MNVVGWHVDEAIKTGRRIGICDAGVVSGARKALEFGATSDGGFLCLPKDGLESSPCMINVSVRQA